MRVACAFLDPKLWLELQHADLDARGIQICKAM
jgi:hypothetical protein